MNRQRGSTCRHNVVISTLLLSLCQNDQRPYTKKRIHQNCTKCDCFQSHRLISEVIHRWHRGLERDALANYSNSKLAMNACDLPHISILCLVKISQSIQSHQIQRKDTTDPSVRIASCVARRNNESTPGRPCVTLPLVTDGPGRTQLSTGSDTAVVKVETVTPKLLSAV